ncbi:tyrosine 2,3-aminomutase [Chondromyces crocatus]|uniref:Tyrosine 2,3-aminomutase n=2 Tax=Chondromyces crocatus TaxID=52 RepID=TAM_CHOCO|nr:tyrosine 2,3-aminomutase [Chondromyces crocatus]Q0VZ68.1 RecName: Full=Tyrosine 2,3-aminomutase; AltName: Full=Tyrosine ammonia-lyase [Chondromyces crocatus]AKT40593.1 histidine ammonia-lyase [Chondromyces crocatus]CAJ46694.1 tyrosine aminomutase [Chondromyces crocatus]
MKITGSNLSIYDVADVCMKRATVELDPSQLERVAVAHERTQAWGEAQHPIYGVNTGFGELVPVMIPRQHKRELQENLIRSHAAGGGEPFADDVVRAIMLARLNCLMKGYSGASVETVKLLAEFINRGIHPVIPQQGSLGASGDLSPLSHIALALIGEGTVSFKGQVRKTGDVLREEGLKPLELGFKGGLTLINGTSAMTGAACVALGRAYHLFRLALLATADFVQCLGGSTGPFEERGHLPKNHSGQVIVAREIRKLLAGSQLTSDHQDLMKEMVARSGVGNDVVDTGVYLQDAYTLRAVPQILGPVLDTLDFARKLIEEELNSTNDNPLIFDVPEQTFHGANFHGQYVAMACDYLNIAVTEIGVLAERQLNRLVDPNINGKLPPFLASAHSGLLCGFEGGQYLATSIASENLDLAAPSSIKSLPSNGSNQDVVSMGTTSARKSLRLCENVGTIVSTLIAACNQAGHILGNERFSPPIRELHGELSRSVPLYQDDSPIFELFQTVRAFVGGDGFRAHLVTHLDLAATTASS